jgi:hypothetical protein
MRGGHARCSLAAMTTPTILRLGAIACVFSVIAQVITTILAPSWFGPLDAAVSSVRDSADVWMAWWLIHLVGTLLILLAFVVVIRTLDGTDGGEWARLCLPMAIVATALGCAQVLTGGSLFDLAVAATDGSSASQAGYLAAFDAMLGATRFIDDGGIMVFALSFLVLAAAILVGREYRHAIGWLCAVGSVLLLVGTLAEMGVDEAPDVAGLINLAGVFPIEIAFISLAVSLWRRAARVGEAATTLASPGLDPATAAR